jgi:hypothetical protein
MIALLRVRILRLAARRNLPAIVHAALASHGGIIFTIDAEDVIRRGAIQGYRNAVSQ